MVSKANNGTSTTKWEISSGDPFTIVGGCVGRYLGRCWKVSNRGMQIPCANTALLLLTTSTSTNLYVSDLISYLHAEQELLPQIYLVSQMPSDSGWCSIPVDSNIAGIISRGLKIGVLDVLDSQCLSATYF